MRNPLIRIKIKKLHSFLKQKIILFFREVLNEEGAYYIETVTIQYLMVDKFYLIYLRYFLISVLSHIILRDRWGRFSGCFSVLSHLESGDGLRGLYGLRGGF